MFRLHFPLVKVVNKNLQRNAILHRVTACVKYSSSSNAEAVATQMPVADSGEYVQPAAAQRKPKSRQPLVKNFFLGTVDKQLLAYPEVITREDLATLRNDLQPVKDFFTDSVDARTIEATGTMPPDVLEGVRELGLYGLNALQDFGGKGWPWSASLMVSEEEARCSELALTLLSHRVVIDLLNELGTEEQKQRFIPNLANGSMLATEAVYEYSTPEYDFFNTFAEYDLETRNWTLNGEKSFVITGPRPSGTSLLYLVIAQTKRESIRGDENRGTTFFLVDSSSEGVKVGDPHSNFGFKAVQTSRVHFENVRLSEVCILGEKHEANVLTDKLLRSARLRQSLIGMVMARKVMNEMGQHFLHTRQCGVPLHELNINQYHLSESMCATYAMESMIYFTAGLLDAYEEQDITLESAITKYFTLRELSKMSNKFIDILGPKALLAGQPTEVAIRNATQLYGQGETLDMLALYIASVGLQYAGVDLRETVKKYRNPLFYPMFAFKNFFKMDNIDNPKVPKLMRLGDNLHPSLNEAARCLEQSVTRLRMASACLLYRHGAAVVEQHSDLRRLTDMVTYIYAMFASVSRASRSYCIGLELADHELLLATSISMHGNEQVKRLCYEAYYGKYMNNDNNFHRLGKQVAKKKRYFPVHPLTYNY